MSLHADHHHHGAGEPEGHDQCIEALSRIQEFLHQEMDEQDADIIREHLAACDRCLDTFDLEQAIAALIKRCHPAPACPSGLRARITSMRVETIRITRTD